MALASSDDRQAPADSRNDGRRLSRSSPAIRATNWTDGRSIGVPAASADPRTVSSILEPLVIEMLTQALEAAWA
jgi:hypothetical protein